MAYKRKPLALSLSSSVFHLDSASYVLAVPRYSPTLARLADENDAAAFGHMTPREAAALRRVLERFVEHHALKGSPID